MHYAEYAIYEHNIHEFFKDQGITHLSVGNPPRCIQCGGQWSSDGEYCLKCSETSESQNEPWFSWTPCDCCGDPQGGNRHHASGWNTEKRDRNTQWFVICETCAYYVEYGCLDDLAMEEVETTRAKAEPYEADNLTIEPPDEEGKMRVTDEHGNMVDVYEPGDTEWWEWIEHFQPKD